MRTFANLAICAIALFLTLIGADFLLQWQLKIPGQEIKQVCTLDPSQKPSKRLKKNLNVDLVGAFNEYRYHVKTNHDGFRQTGETPAKNHFEMIFLGDSQTFGVGVNDDETFVAKTGKLLKKSVLNTACPGYNNIEELQMAKQILKTQRPKYLVLCFFAGNDAYENYSNRLKREPTAKVLEVHSKNKIRRTSFDFKSFLAKKSAIYNLLMRLRQFEAINNILFKFNLVKSLPPPELIVFRKGYDAQKEIFLEVTKNILSELNQLAVTSGAHLLIVLIPDRFQVEDDYWNQWVKKYKLDEKKYDRLEPNRQLKVFIEQNQIDFLDLTPALQQQSKKRNKVYWVIDSHLNRKGHLTIANALADHIKNLNSE